MKVKLPFLLTLSLSILFIVSGYSQLSTTEYRSRNKVDIKPKEIKKLTFIQLEGRNEKKFPDSYLLGMRDDNLILATDISSGFRDKANYVKAEVNLKNYDYLTMVNRKEKFKKMAIWGSIFGALGYYFVQKNSKPSPYEARNKIILGQPVNNGVAEGIMGGITGAGFGIIIGAQLARKRINLKNQSRKAVRKLKEFSFY